MEGRLLALIIIVAIIGMIEVLRFIYNHIKLEDEVIDLRKRLGR